jgi:serine phosphatase RsbU (regulator of sigma subunit)
MRNPKTIFFGLMAMLLASFSVSCNNSTDNRQIDTTNWAKDTHQLFLKAQNYYNTNQSDSLVSFAPEAMKICEEHQQWQSFYDIWNLLTENYVWEDEFDKAVTEAQRMQEDAIKRNSKYGLFNAYRALGTAYCYRENHEEAVKFLQKAIDNYVDIPFTTSMVTTYRMYIESLTKLHCYEAADSALHNMKADIDSSSHVSPSNPRMWANWNFYYQLDLAQYLTANGKYQAAEQALDSCDYYEEQEGGFLINQMLICTQRSQLARAQKDYVKALKYSSREMEISEELGDNSSKMATYTEIVSALQGMGRYKEALETQLEANAFNDSLKSANNAEQLNELNKKFEVNELKMKSEREKMQAERTQLYLLIAIVAIVLIAVIVFILSRLQSARRLAKVIAQKERMESELSIARGIQMSMVPSEFPQREGLDMFASMNPAKEVGGDLYDYLLTGDKLYFCLGDVSGKGVPAALFMAQATRLFRAIAKQNHAPATIATRINTELTENNEQGMFVTMFIGCLDLLSGRLDFCNAGHNPPVIGGGEHHGEFLTMLPNAPIGLWPRLEYQGEQIDNIKARALFLYTDGLNEAENRQQEQFGDDRLLELLRNTHFDTARQVVETLNAAVEEHRNGAEPNDDLTMMCIRKQ